MSRRSKRLKRVSTALRESPANSLKWFRFWVPAEGETLRTSRTVFICALVGIVVGLFAIWFFSMIEWVRVYLLESFGHIHAPIATGEAVLAHPLDIEYTLLSRMWSGGTVCGLWIPDLGEIFAGLIRFLLPGLGAFAACLLARKFAPSASGHGTDTVIAAYHHSATQIPVAVAPVKVMASSLVIGTGGSAGAEGPITQIGATLGAFIGRVLKLSVYEQRILLAAGMAAGIGAIFRAPMAGALFASEVLYRGFDLDGEVLISSMVASTVAYMTYACAFNWEPVFQTQSVAFSSPEKFLCYTLLAFLIAAAVRFNILFFRQTEIAFHRIRTKAWFKPLIGGLMVGFIGLFCPEILSSGYGYIQDALLLTPESLSTSKLLMGTCLLLGILKTIATSFTVGSGGSGGMLGPSLFSGAMYGAAVGLFFNNCFPGLGISPANCAMLGMSGYLTAAVRTPLAAILMVSEFTGNHTLLLPSMWVCGLAFLLTPGWTLYKGQVRDRDSSPAHIRKHESLRHDVAVRLKAPQRKAKHQPPKPQS